MTSDLDRLCSCPVLAPAAWFTTSTDARGKFGAEREALDEWMTQHSVGLTAGVLTGDFDETKHAWGVKSLPWLILTGRDRVVVAEGFSASELDEELTE